MNYTIRRFRALLLFGLIAVFSHVSMAQTSNDSQRVANIDRVVSAFEQYATQAGSYKVGGAGANGSGQGWFHYVGGTYSTSIANALTSAGFLSSPTPKDPAQPDPGEYSVYDFLVYRCEDRIAVFSKADDLPPKTADLEWWQSNNCTQSPFNRDHTYFALSASLSSSQDDYDSQRVVDVDRVVSALEQYAAENSSYKVIGAGANNNGQGWFHYAGGTYRTSIFDALNSAGFLSTPPPQDPAQTDIESYSVYDFLVYRCEDRIAVFSQADDITPDSEDLDWWQGNGCTQAPFSREHPYFALSASLDYTQPEYDVQRVVDVDRVIFALEQYAIQNRTYRVRGAGANGNGQGWFHLVGGTYATSIADALTSSSFLSSPLPKDPLQS